MPDFNIVKKSEFENTFRIAAVKGKFDLQNENIIETFEGSIDLPEEWNIGLIVGNSGTGKTTIAKELFPKSYITQFDYSDKSIVDEMPKGVSIDKIIKTFNSVGFSSPPSWLKPYNVLSTGEKMRADLAFAMLQKRKLFVFDEFTSVVDRNVAKIGSFAIQKAIRKDKEKQFIAISPHFDIVDWLLPDWIFYTNDMTFVNLQKQKKNRPEIKAEIRIVRNTNEKREVWRELGKYHYLNHSFALSSMVFVLYFDKTLIGCVMVMHFPHPKIKNFKREHRTIIKPDYQGIGFGNLLSNYVAKYLTEKGYRFICITSAPSMIYSRKKNPNWKCTRIGRADINDTTRADLRKTSSRNRITVSWEYIPD